MSSRVNWILVCSLLVAGTALAEEKKAAAPAPAKAPKPMPDAEQIKVALTAGPSDVTKDAMIMTVDADGKLRMLKEGKNGWMCMAVPEIMCADKEWQGFIDAWINKKDPQVKGVGIAYMLKGDKGVSNSDPFAEKETADNNWIVSPPHIMVLSPDTKMLDTMSSDPNNGGPWVMWKGTKYAHIMVPTTPMPAKKPAPKAAPAKPAAPAK